MKKLSLIFLLLFTITISACSSNDESTAEAPAGDIARNEMSMEMEMDDSIETSQDSVSREPDIEEANRKVIYHAYLELEVKHYQQALAQIEADIANRNGYIVNNETNRYDNDFHRGEITARIPQEDLQTFLSTLETTDIDIIHRSVSGQDVTEQYIDLESRLSSKEIVEERLLSFMEDAEITEDLLNISRDLADVQTEIEQIRGQLNYLENKSDLATVTLHITETRVERIQDKDLNTWERTKNQLMKSVNFLLAAGSGLVVFTIGNLPVIFIVILVGLIGYRLFRKHNKQEN